MVESHMNLANDKTKAYIMASIYDIHAKKYEMMVNEKLIMDSLQAMFGQPSSSLMYDAIKYMFITPERRRDLC